jgi:hypothetical protein
MFEDPTRHFMVDYGERKINLYYPGVSFFQLPFFIAGHLAAKLFQTEADGFSFPYQLAMGLAGLFYGLLGLYFCKKLLCGITGDRTISTGVSLLIFFGTQLFTYTVYNGCYSHCYSFCFITLFYYSFWLCFNAGFSARNILSVIFFAAAVITIRPVNILALSGCFFFLRRVELKPAPAAYRRGRIITGLILLLAMIVYNVSVTYAQTGSFIANTYTIGKFLWHRWDRVLSNVSGFQNGMLWYTPLLVVALMSLFRIRKQPRLIWIFLPVIALIVLYSLWWYWIIAARTLTDIMVLFAILLAFFLQHLSGSRRRIAVAVCLFCVLHFQLKAYQLRNGILDSTYTYRGFYFRHYFTLSPIDAYPVNPATVIEKQEFVNDFEDSNPTTPKFDNQVCATLNAQVEYAGTTSYVWPEVFKKKGFKKLRASFDYFRTEEHTNTQFVITFMKGDSVTRYFPFYINARTPAGRWVHKEFGFGMEEAVPDVVKIYFWNPDLRNSAYIDNLKMEFMLTNGSDEITDD